MVKNNRFTFEISISGKRSENRVDQRLLNKTIRGRAIVVQEVSHRPIQHREQGVQSVEDREVHGMLDVDDSKFKTTAHQAVRCKEGGQNIGNSALHIQNVFFIAFFEWNVFQTVEVILKEHLCR